MSFECWGRPLSVLRRTSHALSTAAQRAVSDPLQTSKTTQWKQKLEHCSSLGKMQML